MTPETRARGLDPDLVRYVNLKLTALAEPVSRATADPGFMEIVAPLLRNHLQKDRLLGWPLCPVDTRIQAFLDRPWPASARRARRACPARTFVLDRPGLARVLSLPATGDRFASPYLTSYRTQQGVLHNPQATAAPPRACSTSPRAGCPSPTTRRPFRSGPSRRSWPRRSGRRRSSTGPPLHRRPAATGAPVRLAPAAPAGLSRPPTGIRREKPWRSASSRPAAWSRNLDFVESIFGNGGDPYLPENDAALDVLDWTGHTGCVILAPHLVRLTQARARAAAPRRGHRRASGATACAGGRPASCYNGGKPFKITARDEAGVIVTVIADNYFGYCKKEVKTQISFAANLFGLAEEEHAGGALVFPSYVLGEDFYGDRSFRISDATFEDAIQLLGDRAEVRPEGYAVDRHQPDIFYVAGERRVPRPPGRGPPGSTRGSAAS